VSSPASAVSIPFQVAYNGPVSFHLSDWDEGTLYTGKYSDGTPVTTFGVPISASLLQKISPAKAIGGEDAWGIVRVETIYNAALTGPNAMTIGSTLLYSKGDAGTELVGIFTGRKDDTVTFYSNGKQDIYSDPLGWTTDRITLYIQPDGTADAAFAAGWIGGMGGPNSRMVGGNYPGIGFDATNTAYLNSGVVLTGTVTPGFENGGLDGAYADFRPSGNTGTGTFDMYITWDGGTELNRFHSVPGIFPFMGGPGAPYTADAFLAGTIKATSVPSADPWLVSTSDPAYMYAVPEPVTMASMLLGIGCLSRYIRKRR
jgi:hypothetical protein